MKDLRDAADGAVLVRKNSLSLYTRSERHIFSKTLCTRYGVFRFLRNVLVREMTYNTKDRWPESSIKD